MCVCVLLNSVCMYILVLVHVHVCLCYRCVFTQVYMYNAMSCIYAHVFNVWILCTCTCMYYVLYLYVYMYMHTYMHTYMYMYKSLYTCDVYIVSQPFVMLI